MLDPMGGKAVLKEVIFFTFSSSKIDFFQKYKHAIKEKDERIKELEYELHKIASDNRQSVKINRKYETELSILTKKKDDEMYQMRLEYEERGRKQMESYARELSIRYANSNDNDTIDRLKKSAEGLLGEKKALEKKVKTLEK